MKRVVARGLVTLAASHPCLAADASQTDKLKRLSLEELGNVEATSVSGEPEEIWQTPDDIYVLTQDDIRRSGANRIPDILRTLPEVKVAEEEGDAWVVAMRSLNRQFSPRRGAICGNPGIRSMSAAIIMR